MTNCTVKECENKHLAKGLCRKHYYDQYNTPESNSYHSMNYRCNNKNSKSYDCYGGRGIEICDRWKNSPDNFFEDMGKRPKGMTLDRKDNGKGYSPDNCQWATKHEQCANRRGNNKIVGVNFNKRDDIWQSRLMINKKYVLDGRFKTYEQAVKARKQAEIEYGVLLH